MERDSVSSFPSSSIHRSNSRSHERLDISSRRRSEYNCILCHRISAKPATVLDFQRLLGLTASSTAVMPFTRLLMHPLQLWFHCSGSRSVTHSTYSSFIVEVVLTADTSLWGWSSRHEGHSIIQLWSIAE